MPLQKIQVEAGQNATYTVTLTDAKGRPVAFTGAESLAADLWLGSTQSAISHPAVAWDTPSLGTLTLTFSASATASLAGPYHVRVYLPDTSQTVWVGLVVVNAIAGSTAAPSTLGTYADLVDYFEEIDKFDEASSDDWASQFLFQRSVATQWLIRVVQRWYTEWFFRRRVQEGWRTVAPTPSAFAAIIQGGGLQLNDRLRELLARYAIALVLESTFTPGKEDKNQYQAYAAQNRDRAFSLVDGLRVHVVDVPSGLDFWLDSEGVRWTGLGNWW